MRCQQQRPLQPPLPEEVRARALEGELGRLVPSARYGLGGQSRPSLWDAMMRGLMNAESPQAQSQQQQQQQQEEEDDGHESTVVIKRSRTNSERGRAFRERRKRYEDELVTLVGSLRQEVADLGFLRSVRADKVLRSRNSMGGSLVRVAREYFALFERGMPSVRGAGHKRPALLTDGSAEDDGQDSFETKQETFIRCAMDPELHFGEASGPQALLDQWKRYSSYHASMCVEVVGVEVSGEEDNPMVTVRSDLHVVFSRDTFDHVFPHVADNEELVTKFIGREVVYHGVNRFQFSPQGQILIYDSDVGFVDALVQAGASVSDIALLMQQARIADECRLGEEGNNNNNNSRVQELEPDNQDPSSSPESESNSGSDCAFDADSDDAAGPSDNGAASLDARSTDRLAIDFLLS
ncbi:hypothetical protein PF008_g20062 [Phytophthora fragariae]|uniref:BZIP domain-containing protein n=1 Tax=Phytophthora fragariae TaxID=53985 RepID=A0A6G0R0K4_9STRA|nr:hypothetical protein PF008_g20062 [Phytophthora fragariae]